MALTPLPGAQANCNGKKSFRRAGPEGIYLISSYRDGLALKFVAGQFGEGPVGVLAPEHADESASARRNQIDGGDLAVRAKSVRQLFLLDQFAQVAHPEGRAAHCGCKMD